MAKDTSCACSIIWGMWCGVVSLGVEPFGILALLLHSFQNTYNKYKSPIYKYKFMQGDIQILSLMKGATDI